MADRISSARGRDYAIHVHCPDDDPPPGGHPLIWLLDAPTTWAPMRQALHECGDAGAAVVGIDWVRDGPVDPGLRRRDFTLPVRHQVPPPRGSDGWHEDGDADAFLDFLTGTLQPRYLRMLPVDRTRQTLVGHSLSGLFVLRTLMVRPRQFAAYVAASPSIWWDGARLFERAAGADWREARGSRVLVTVGSQEQAAGPEKPPEVAGEDAAAMLGEPHMIANAQRFAGLLQAAGIDCDFRVFQDEGHHSVLRPAMAAALDFACRLPAD